MSETQLLPEAVRRRLDGLTLMARKVRAGAYKGERRSLRRGTSIEFADYRNYSSGDDLRQLDWNIYARLERPYIKLLEDEEDLTVHLLLDTSASMDWPQEGEPEHNKLLYASRLFVALAYIALAGGDRLQLAALSDRGTHFHGPARGQAATVGMLRYAHELAAGGLLDLNAALRDYALRVRRPGLLFLISDMFSPGGYLDGLNTLLGKGYEVTLLHVLSADELQPPLAGDLRLIDVETGGYEEVSVDAAMRTLYMERALAWRDGIYAECARRGVHYLPLQTSTPWEKAVLYDLRRLGLVK